MPIQGKQIANSSIAAAKLSSDVGGAGLASTSGVLSVNAGNGLGISGDDVIIDLASTVAFSGASWTFGVDELSVGTPTAGTSAANKTYVDNLVNGARWKGNADLATSVADGNLTLSGEQTIDGTLTSTSRVLVKSQTAGAENGIYVTAAGAWARATDMDSGTEADSAAVYIEGGTENGGSAWTQTTDSVTIGTTAQVYVQFNGAGSIDAGTGLTKTGNTINVIGGDGITANANDIALDLKTSGGLKIDTAQLAVEPADFAGTGLEDDGSDNLRLATQGTGIAGGAGSTLSVDTTATLDFSASGVISVATQAPGTNSVLAASTAFVTAAVAAAGGSLSAADDEFAPATGSGDGVTTGKTITATPDGNVLLTINGVKVTIGDGVKTKDAYFSVDAGTTARALSAIVAGDTLFWNGVVAGYDLLVSTDIGSLIYEV